MTQKDYIQQILEPIVLPWIERGDQFVLEEDGDSGHGPSQAFQAKRYRTSHSMFGCIPCLRGKEKSTRLFRMAQLGITSLESHV